MKMIEKDKNKSKIETKSKILVLGLILIILVGLFSPMANVNAQTRAPGVCVNILPDGAEFDDPSQTKDQCENSPEGTTRWDPKRIPVSDEITRTRPEGETALERALGTCSPLNMDACILQIAYFIFGTIPAFLLTVAASFFNIVVALTLGSALYTKANFIGDAWTVVRDLSNIFFILILLYIAVKTILGLGGHDVKKMIVSVIIMALLINFSMFMTKVVIDTSNILALIFYDKLVIETVKVEDAVAAKNGYIPVLNPATTGIQDKDISGAIMSGFDPSKLLTDDFFNNAKKQTVGLSFGATATWTATGALAGSFIPLPIIGTAIGAGGGYFASRVVGWFVQGTEIPLPLMLGIIIITGLIMYFAMYTFFIAGLAFLGRILELWVLIIFSPFAFMSFTIPLLGHIDYIGWDAWLKRLLSVSFLAPIFLFFIYFIFLIVRADIFQSLTDRSFENQGTLEAIVLVLIPALLILILLKKATDYAQKASGVVGEWLMKGAGLVTGLAIGGGLGVIAAGLQGNLGKRSYDWSRKGANKKWAANSLVGRKAMQIAKWSGQSSFDLRKGVVGAGLGIVGGATGLDFGERSKILVKKDGGYAEDRRREVAEKIKEAEELKVGEDETLTQILHELQRSHQDLLRKENPNGKGSNEQQIKDIDEKLVKLAKKSSNAQADMRVYGKGNIDPSNGKTYEQNAKDIRTQVRDLNKERSAIKDATMFRKSDGTLVDHRENTIDGNLSDEAIRGIEQTALVAITDALANPTNVAFANTAAVATAARDAAHATRDVTLIDNLAATVKAAAANPVDAKLAAAVDEANAEVNKHNANVARSTATANASAATVAHLAAQNPNDINLNNAAVSTNNALNRINKGLIGRSINNLEDTDMKHAQHAIETEDKSRIWARAEYLEKSWFPFGAINYGLSRKEAKEATHKMRMGAKSDSGGGGHN